jgi:hypothetical protein
MKKILILAYMACACVLTSQAQVRIVNSTANTAVSNSPAFIDASSNSAINGSTNVGKGLVFPRVDLSVMAAFPLVTSGVAIAFPTRFDGMIVYNTAESGTAGVGNTEGTLTPGFWYYENKSSTNDGGTWKPVSNPAYTGSSSITLNGASIERAALTGDVTAAANSNATTIANSAVTATKIANNAVTEAKIANNAVTAAKLNQMGASSGQVLKWNGSAWAPAADANDTNTAYSGSTSITINGSEIRRAALTGDVTASANNNATSIANGAVTASKLAQMGASSGQVLKWSGSAWSPATDNTGLSSESDGVIGNEITNVTSGGFLTRSGSGTASSPYTVGIDKTNAVNYSAILYYGGQWRLGRFSYYSTPSRTLAAGASYDHGIIQQCSGEGLVVYRKLGSTSPAPLIWTEGGATGNSVIVWNLSSQAVTYQVTNAAWCF